MKREYHFSRTANYTLYLSKTVPSINKIVSSIFVRFIIYLSKPYKILYKRSPVNSKTKLLESKKLAITILLNLLTSGPGPTLMTLIRIGSLILNSPNSIFIIFLPISLIKARPFAN